ncbi:MAG TPA: histidine--tRNA ligase [Candidatus Nanoarchaeia archaeon]|nr:histidine--tRNA ligase [Candidatus Nanoarchaeia archaeon]
MKLENSKGTRDFAPEEKIVRDEVINTLKEVFELYGFSPLETPILNLYEIFESKYGGGSEILKEIFKLTDQGERRLGLRFDLTVPLAKFVGMNPDLKMPFKRYEIGRAFRDGPVKTGRLREFWQCDVDIVGAGSMLADAEILAVVDSAFKKLGLPIIIKLSNRKFLEGVLDFSGVSKDKRFDAIIAIDKLEKLGESEVVKEMEQKGIADDAVAKIMSIIKMKGSNNELISRLKGLIKSGIGSEGLKEIEELLTYCDSFGVGAVEFCPSLARGLAYYTGPVYEVFIKDSKISSAAAGGGRYDEMIGGYLGGKKQYPATGIAFGLEVITEALKEKGKLRKKSVAEVFVIPIKTEQESIRIAEELRESGIKTEIDLLRRGISKNLAYANSMAIPYVIIIGDKELKQSKVKLRDMKSGKEEMLSTAELIGKLR